VAEGGAADCCRPGAKARADSAQQQPAKTIPAVAPEKFFRNSLRVGMVASYGGCVLLMVRSSIA